MKPQLQKFIATVNLGENRKKALANLSLVDILSYLNG